MSEQRQLATIRETAARAQADGLGVSENALRDWIAGGLLPFVPCGNRRMVYWPALIEFLQTGQRIDPNPAPLPRYGRGSRGGKRR